ncbi:hypothetical protein P9139_20090 [Curtobacterium flaccumfaciens]|nr:hypothetical protein P9139_20090 [Curtobacterium flaccumfaciens]
MTATESITRPKLRSGVSAAAPANAARIGVSGRGFNIAAAIVLTVFAIIWLIPSLFALKTSLSDNGVAALGANAILSNWNPTLHSYASLFQAGTSGTGTSPAGSRAS